MNKVKAHESLQTAIQEENDVVGSITQQVKVSLPPLPPTSRSLAHVSTWSIYRSINFISSALCFARPPFASVTQERKEAATFVKAWANAETGMLVSSHLFVSIVVVV